MAIFVGDFSQEQAIESVDFNTIGGRGPRSGFVTFLEVGIPATTISIA